MKRCMQAVLLAATMLGQVAQADPPIPTQIAISHDFNIQNEEQVWVSPTAPNILIAAWRDFRLGYRQVGIGRSLDYGVSWTGDTLINPSNQIFEWQSDPTLTVDAEGNFYLCVVDFQDMPFGYDSCYLSWHVSSDSGVSWQGPYTVLDSIGPFFEDKPFTAVDRTGSPYHGNIYVAWARYYSSPGPDAQILFARSTTGAVTWDDTLVIAPVRNPFECGSTPYASGQFAFPLVGSDGSVYVLFSGLYLDESPGCELRHDLEFIKSTNGGVSFGKPHWIRDTHGHPGQVDGNIDVYASPAAAADISGGPYDGNIYVAYANLDTTNTSFIDSDYNIEFIRSEDGAASWSEPIYVNDDYTGDSATIDQFHPWISCDENDGTIAAIWYDQRLDPVNHFLFWLYAAYSFDGGATFTTNHRISELAVDPDDATPPFAPEDYLVDILRTPSARSRAGKLAEYIGVSTAAGKVHAVWTGTGPEGIFDLGIGQNVYGASWEIPLLPPRPIAPAGDSSAKSLADSITFVWSTCWKSDSDAYYIEVASVPDFSSSLVKETISDNSINTPAALFVSGTPYYWRVRAIRELPGGSTDSTEFSVTAEFSLGGCCALRGDMDHSGALDISDLTYFVDYLFSGGSAPICSEESDVDGSGATDITDLTYLVDYLFSGGPPPAGC